MTLNIAQLRDRVAIMFPDVEQVDDSVIRFTKKVGEQPYAVYYLDIAHDLPSSQETLTKYQDRVIGRYYFKGRKSLQWSNYLYFITSRDRLVSGEVIDAKELIERDRSYARKFVIPEEEIELVLRPPLITPAETTPHAGILSIWTEILVDADLDRAILSDDDLPTRLRLIETSPTGPKPISRMPISDKLVHNQPFIHLLKLKRFREFPIQRDFEFGRANLIFGHNGSGKTSLLEAIELFYCGRNKRNPDARPTYSIAVVFSNSNTETATASRKQQIFRDRNLMWYGQPEVRTNNLYQSFSQFNFLDTDAAVDLADSTSRIKDNLSKLLVGPEASKVWRNIERVTDEVANKLKGLKPLKVQIESELKFLDKLISEASNVRQESDSILIRLKAMIDRLGWRIIQDDKEAFSSSLVEPLAELVSIAEQATKIEWTASPVSMEGMGTYCRNAKLVIDKTTVDLTRLELLRKEQRSIQNTINRDRRALDIVKQVRRFIDADLLSRAEQLSNLQTKVETLSGWLAGLDADDLDTVLTTVLEISVADFQGSLISTRAAAEKSLTDSNKEYKEFSELRNQSLNLALQLRDIATKLIQGSPRPDECPLCHTLFKSGELEKHINIGVDEHLEVLGQTLLTNMRMREGELRDVLAIDTAFGSLMKFCERANHATDMSIRSVLIELNNTKSVLTESKGRLSILKSEMDSLVSQGISLEKLEEITDRLRELGYTLNLRSDEDVNRLPLTIEQSLDSLSKTLDNHRKESDDLQHAVVESLGSTDPKGQDLDGKLSIMRERLAETETIQEKLSHFSSSLPWPPEKPLVDMILEAELIRKVAAEQQAALGREKQAKASYVGSVKKKEQLEKQLAELLPLLDRYSKAHSVLKALQKNHSLNSAMDTALQDNRTAIETIFSQIHSPAEFRGIGSNWSTLIRKMDDTKAELTEISTGQRAAFALSIFLAQNAKLKVATPVVLIDDPIAHLDDMNSLSFLDYLREVALKGQKQIFFATASDKLAALIERKFDFLGSDGFRRINLTRNT